MLGEPKASSPALHQTDRVTLTPAQRDELSALRSRGKAEVGKLTHAQVLLKTDWQFTTADARVKLSKLYPSVQS